MSWPLLAVFLHFSLNIWLSLVLAPCSGCQQDSSESQGEPWARQCISRNRTLFTSAGPRETWQVGYWLRSLSWMFLGPKKAPWDYRMSHGLDDGVRGTTHLFLLCSRWTRPAFTFLCISFFVVSSISKFKDTSKSDVSNFTLLLLKFPHLVEMQSKWYHKTISQRGNV